jgi:hypothetical protein
MRVTAFLPTHDLAEEAMPWMEEVRSVFDGLVIFIDERRVTPGTVTRAKKVATRVYHHKAETWYEWDLAAMARQCESEWVFLIERDEQLSPEWQQNSWRQILGKTEFTHFGIPRRWVVPEERYITADPWWPDFQLRLLRTNVPGAIFPTTLHEPFQVPGPGGYLRNLAIHHHVLWLSSRATREERMRYYEQLRPGGSLSHYYLYEDYAPAQASLPKPVTLNVNREIARMERLSSEEVSRIFLEVSDVPRDVHCSVLFWLDAQVTNATDAMIYPVAPYPVRLAYHWIERATRQMVLFDGNRSGLFPGLEPKATRRYPMTILAPNQPGEYILQATMVQDGVCWFEDINRGIVQEFPVSVIA